MLKGLAPGDYREEELPLLEEAKTSSLRRRGSLTQESNRDKEKSGSKLGRYDKDGDGKLSKEERKALLEDLLSPA